MKSDKKTRLNMSEIYDFAHDLRRLQVFFFCIKRAVSKYISMQSS